MKRNGREREREGVREGQGERVREGEGEVGAPAPCALESTEFNTTTKQHLYAS